MIPSLDPFAAEDVTVVNPMSNIAHVVVVMLENRSFDNLLGWLYGPGKPPAAGHRGQGRRSAVFRPDGGQLLEPVERVVLYRSASGKGVRDRGARPGRRPTRSPIRTRRKISMT